MERICHTCDGYHVSLVRTSLRPNRLSARLGSEVPHDTRCIRFDNLTKKHSVPN
jgi:hypothetical protein